MSQPGLLFGRVGLKPLSIPFSPCPAWHDAYTSDSELSGSHAKRLWSFLLGLTRALAITVLLFT